MCFKSNLIEISADLPEISNKCNKTYNTIFIIFVSIISIFILSIGFAIPITNDDWIYSSIYPSFYPIYKFDGYFWQRGRHVADILMALPMRSIGHIMIYFGLEPLIAQKIAHSLFWLIYTVGQFFALSFLIWILNNKRNFKIVFVVVSMFSFYLFNRSMNDMTNVAAYIGSAAVSIFVLLPLLYYWINDKEFDFFKSSKVLFCIIWTFLMYAATFTIEQSSLPVTGLSFFVLLFYLIKYKKEKIAQPYSIIYLLIINIAFSVSAFLLTLNSGRGKMQFERIDDGTTTIDRIISSISNYYTVGKIVLIAGLLYSIYLIIRALLLKQLSKKDYIKLSLMFTGILGVIGFSAIKVSYALPALFVFSGVFLGLLDSYKRKMLSTIIIITIIVLMPFEIIKLKNMNFNRIMKKSDVVLVNLFIEADKNGDSSILLTDIIEPHLKADVAAWPNRDISYWMQYYGYTKEYITIQVISEE